jgi:2-oxoglutarate ferredoxin oxidoreductase subunit gamma
VSTHRILIAGFGGQGVQFAGRLLAHVGMYMGKEVSFLSSYGPEMRGGTSNCSVQISDEFIASPLVLEPTELIVMNGPSLEKFEKTVVSGGRIYIDSSIVTNPATRSDIARFLIPATGLAEEQGLTRLANVIFCGMLLKKLNLCPLSALPAVLKEVVSAKRPELLEGNMKALAIGYAM